jgi:hypothetical protein
MTLEEMEKVMDLRFGDMQPPFVAVLHRAKLSPPNIEILTRFFYLSI